MPRQLMSLCTISQYQFADATRIEVNKRVDSGRWYKVTATRNNRVGSVSVEDCAESGEHCKTCQGPDDARCFAKTVGSAGTLVFGDNPMMFGGKPDAGPGDTPRTGQVCTNKLTSSVVADMIVSTHTKLYRSHVQSLSYIRIHFS